jgi:flagellum-specific ATP synthase
MSVLSAAINTTRILQPARVTGRVSALRGMTILVTDLPLATGSLVAFPRAGDQSSLGEVVGFSGQHAVCMMLGQSLGIRPGDPVVGLQAMASVNVSDQLLGRCIDGLGRPIDGLGPVHDVQPRAVEPEPIVALRRRRVTKPLYTGIKAIDLMTTLGRGQRMGIFAGPGVGKSTLLGSITKFTSAEVVVIGLIGERGREVKDFVEHVLGPEGMRRAVVVAATGDQSPLLRIRAAQVTCSVAEHFRDRGKQVLLMIDSMTRFAQAQRQVGLSIGEPPASKGYTPSVFANMARLLERAGQLEHPADAPPEVRASDPGSITGLYTILVEGDDMTEPVADAARGILDGHIILSRALAQKNHYPAIDVLDSVSRVADDVCEATHIAARKQLVRLMAAYREVEDLVQIGAYAKGSSSETDLAIAYYPRIRELLQQDTRTREDFEATKQRAIKMAIEAGNAFVSAQSRKAS